MEDTLNKFPELDAFTPTGKFPEFLPDDYRNVASKIEDRISSGKLALVVADTLPVQIDTLKEGLAYGNVGQRPFEMGYKSMIAMKDIKDCKPATKEPTYTGLDACTPLNAATCIGVGP